MRMEFEFFGFEPDAELRSNAQRSLEKLIDLAPYGSVPVALIEKNLDGYRCAIELYTKRGPFIANSQHLTPDAALTQVCEKLLEKLARWNRRRAIAKTAVSLASN